jgi:hypothetical protein
LFNEITKISAYSTVVTVEKEVSALLEHITSCLAQILLTITAYGTGEVPKVIFLLLEVTQARRN